MEKVSVGIAYLTVLCDHPFLVSLLFAIPLSYIMFLLLALCSYVCTCNQGNYHV